MNIRNLDKNKKMALAWVVVHERIKQLEESRREVLRTQPFGDAQARFPGSQPREIPSLSNTRWVCRHNACKTLSATLPAVVDVLEDATARSLMAPVNTSFVIHLCIFKFLLKVCADASASAELQGKSETL